MKKSDHCADCESLLRSKNVLSITKPDVCGGWSEEITIYGKALFGTIILAENGATRLERSFVKIDTF